MAQQNFKGGKVQTETGEHTLRIVGEADGRVLQKEGDLFLARSRFKRRISELALMMRRAQIS